MRHKCRVLNNVNSYALKTKINDVLLNIAVLQAVTLLL